MMVSEVQQSVFEILVDLYKFCVDNHLMDHADMVLCMINKMGEPTILYHGDMMESWQVPK